MSFRIVLNIWKKKGISVSMLLYFSGPSASMTLIHLVMRILHKPGARACEMLHISLSLMNRLNKTESVIFTSLFWFGCSREISTLAEF